MRLEAITIGKEPGEAALAHVRALYHAMERAGCEPFDGVARAIGMLLSGAGFTYDERTRCCAHAIALTRQFDAAHAGRKGSEV